MSSWECPKCGVRQQGYRRCHNCGAPNPYYYGLDTSQKNYMSFSTFIFLGILAFIVTSMFVSVDSDKKSLTKQNAKDTMEVRVPVERDTGYGAIIFYSTRHIPKSLLVNVIRFNPHNKKDTIVSSMPSNSMFYYKTKPGRIKFKVSHSVMWNDVKRYVQVDAGKITPVEISYKIFKKFEVVDQKTMDKKSQSFMWVDS